MLIAFHKPYGVISQFTPDGSPNKTLAEFKFPPRVYPLGRLDADSEGLILLSDEAGLNSKLLSPKHRHSRTYWAQVERIPSETDLEKLSQGVRIADYTTLPCIARLLAPQPDIPPRIPPIRFRLSVPTSWVELTLHEGKNRQVRKMTAAIGYPTLRLLRVQIGKFALGDLPCGEWEKLGEKEKKLIFT